jgi:hypothetical protein
MLTSVQEILIKSKVLKTRKLIKMLMKSRYIQKLL